MRLSFLICLSAFTLTACAGNPSEPDAGTPNGQSAECDPSEQRLPLCEPFSCLSSCAGRCIEICEAGGCQECIDGKWGGGTIYDCGPTQLSVACEPELSCTACDEQNQGRCGEICSRGDCYSCSADGVWQVTSVDCETSCGMDGGG